MPATMAQVTVTVVALGLFLIIGGGGNWIKVYLNSRHLSHAEVGGTFGRILPLILASLFILAGSVALAAAIFSW
jgi:hypothetical protein